MVLKLNGKPLELKSTPPSVVTIKAFLDKSPADELYSGAELAKATRCNVVTLRYAECWSHERLVGYSEKIGPIRYWGHPKAIAELKKQVAR